MATLRGADGCPWDREQTIDTLRPFVLEEAYEVLEAIDHHDHEALREELGDFLFEAVFLAQIEDEAGHFSIADALQSIADKLVRRHPHVFARAEGEPPVDSADKVKVRWEQIKAAERSSKHPALLDGTTRTMPALLRAFQISSRAASVGFDWKTADDVLPKIEEEVAELKDALSDSFPSAAAEEEMGDLLFAIANLARKLGIEPESALRKANDKFTRRFAAMERSVTISGRTMSTMTLDELEQEWLRAKRAERG